MFGLSKRKLNETVSVTCYGKTREMKRGDAIEHYYDGMCCSEGSEHERYERIFFQLLDGFFVCTDIDE